MRCVGGGVDLEPSLYEARFELAGVYARQNANDKATRVLLGLIAPRAQALLGLADPSAALALLETSLVAVGRQDEATVVSELRALAGDLDARQVECLRARPPPRRPPTQGALGRTTLVAQTVPSAGRHVLLDAAAAVDRVQGEIIRSHLNQL